MDRRRFRCPGQVRVIGVLAFGLAWSHSGAARGDDGPSEWAKLNRAFKTAYVGADYKKALETAEKMHEMRAGDVDTMYNIACMNCLLGDKGKSYEWLEKAVEAGYRDGDHLAKDYDFRRMWGEDRFRGIVKKLRGMKTGAAAGEDGENKKETGKPAESGKSAEGRGAKARSAASDLPKVKDLSPNGHRQKIEELTAKLIEESGDLSREKALEISLEALAHAKALQRKVDDEARPQLSLTHYNVARMFSLMKRKDEAFGHLEEAIGFGGFGEEIAEQIEGDGDFANLRKDARYEKLLDAARKGSRPQRRQAGVRAQGDGEPVEFKWDVRLPKKHDSSKAAPLVIALHHYHGNMKAAMDRWAEAADAVGAILLVPQGTFQISENGYEWGKRIDPVERNIQRAIEEVSAAHKVDADRIVLCGFSQGGWATWEMALRNPDAFRGIIPVCGRPASDVDEALEHEIVKNLRVVIMLGGDEKEELIEANRAAAEVLKKKGASVRVKTYEGVGHGFPENSTEELTKALRFVLEG